MAALPYLQLYPADYLADTMHLNTEQHGAYILLIMNYWQTGKPVHNNDIPAITRLYDRSPNVTQALERFFEIDADGYWIHHRIEFDLAAVLAKSTKAKRAGKISAAKRAAIKATDSKGKSSERSTVVIKTLQPKSNHTDIDIDKDTQKKKKNPLAVRPAGIDEQVWNDFIIQRNTKFTKTAFTLFANQAEKACWSLNAAMKESVHRGWQSFKAEWVEGKKDSKASGQTPWDILLQQIGVVSMNEYPTFEDPLITKALNKAGSWMELCRMTDKQAQFQFRPKFEEAYNAAG